LKLNKHIFKHFGSLSSVYEHNSLVFLLLFTEPLVRGYKDESFDPLYELEANLRKVAGKSVIVCHHAHVLMIFTVTGCTPAGKKILERNGSNCSMSIKLRQSLRDTSIAMDITGLEMCHSMYARRLVLIGADNLHLEFMSTKKWQTQLQDTIYSMRLITS